MEQCRKDLLNLARIRGKLDGLRGQRYWRSLEELADTEEFRGFLGREFPENAAQWLDPVGRRKFLQLMGASLALAGIGACTVQPAEKIVPYVKQPEEILPGKPLFFATAMPQNGIAQALLVESHMGRPTKVEGNPEHPASLGATNVFSQASILSLYDPDRSQLIRRRGTISTWGHFLSELDTALHTQRGRKGRGLRILTETVTSPTLGRQLEQLLSRFPEARWHQWEPAGRENVREGSRLAFGEYVETRYRFDRAERILSLGADFLYSGPGSVRYAADFAGRRRVDQAGARMNRLYVVEPTPSLTGAMADHRLALRAGEMEGFAFKLAEELGMGGFGTPDSDHASWLRSVASDLQRNRGTCLIIAGEEQPAGVHALTHGLNQALGNVGTTVEYSDPIEVRPVNQVESLRELVEAMDAGEVDLLVVMGGNPVYNAPADFRFESSLSKVSLRVHLGRYENETARLCHWHIPETHFLESWGDLRAYDGTVTLMQPLIAPLYSGKSAYEMVSALADQPGLSSHDIVRGHWQEKVVDSSFEQFWRRAVHDGFIGGSALPSRKVALVAEPIHFSDTKSAAEGGLEVLFRADPSVLDGRFANNGWLQELPKPLTKLTWDNAALMSPATAERLGLRNEDRIKLSQGARAITAPVWILPGQTDNSITLHLGYGRTRSGRVGTGIGFNAYLLRTSSTLDFATGVEAEKTGETYRLACTQNHHLMATRGETQAASGEARRRHLIREGTLEEYRHNPAFVREMSHPPLVTETLYDPQEHKYEGYAWGMSIDLNACTGCNACVIACQSENNVPVVGKDQVAKGREMHWLRVDRYYKGSVDAPAVYHQPLPCQHCENAPCELVCPVAATTHSSEGLNEMTYNRCVGTRYCSNNCPYKVRRFNFFLYQDWDTPSLQLMRNPNVSVRSRGVMEKCSYCVQRINAARIEAKNENRKIQDGEIRTACQAVCPSRAIVFGDINDPASAISKLKADQRDYGILTELNTRPRTTYMARLSNPNPEMT
ncbi:MAG: TAT-variant-translocated molybdopterin oxidoreductase [Acidobacteriota bacterium]